MSMTTSQYMGLEERPQLANIIPFRFWIKYKDDPSSPAGRKAEEWVEWHVKLTGSQTIPRTGINSIKAIKKGAERATEPNDEYAMIWRTIEPHYLNWKAGGNNEVVNGTPLSIWPAITADVVELLKPFKIQSVEDLSMIGDGLIQKLPHPNIARFRDMAKKFLALKDTALALRELDDSKGELAAMREEMETMSKALADAEFARREAADAVPDPLAAMAPKRRRMASAEA